MVILALDVTNNIDIVLHLAKKHMGNLKYNPLRFLTIYSLFSIFRQGL